MALIFEIAPGNDGSSIHTAHRAALYDAGLEYIELRLALQVFDAHRAIVSIQVSALLLLDLLARANTGWLTTLNPPRSTDG
jgi:hypothetical protein